MKKLFVGMVFAVLGMLVLSGCPFTFEGAVPLGPEEVHKGSLKAGDVMYFKIGGFTKDVYYQIVCRSVCFTMVTVLNEKKEIQYVESEAGKLATRDFFPVADGTYYFKVEAARTQTMDYPSYSEWGASNFEFVVRPIPTALSCVSGDGTVNNGIKLELATDTPGTVKSYDMVHYTFDPEPGFSYKLKLSTVAGASVKMQIYGPSADNVTYSSTSTYPPDGYTITNATDVVQTYVMGVYSESTDDWDVSSFTVRLDKAPKLSVDTAPVTFGAEGGTKTLSVSNIGGGTMTWSSYKNYNSGSWDTSWLTLTPANGTVEAGQSVEVTVTAAALPTGMSSRSLTIIMSPNASTYTGSSGASQIGVTQTR